MHIHEYGERFLQIDRFSRKWDMIYDLQTICGIDDGLLAVATGEVKRQLSVIQPFAHGSTSTGDNQMSIIFERTQIGMFRVRRYWALCQLKFQFLI